MDHFPKTDSHDAVLNTLTEKPFKFSSDLRNDCGFASEAKHYLTESLSAQRRKLKDMVGEAWKKRKPMAILMKNVMSSFELPVSKAKNGQGSVFVAARLAVMRLVYGIVHSPLKKKESPKPPEAEGEHGHKKTEYYDALDNEYSKAMGGEERDREKYWDKLSKILDLDKKNFPPEKVNTAKRKRDDQPDVNPGVPIPDSGQSTLQSDTDIPLDPALLRAEEEGGQEEGGQQNEDMEVVMKDVAQGLLE